MDEENTINEYLLRHDDGTIPVLHDYGARVKIGLEKPRASLTLMSTALSRETTELSLQERLGEAAYDLRHSPQYNEAKDKRIYKGRIWGDQESTGPKPLAKPLAATTLDSLSDRMAGRIAVGLILVSGPLPRLVLNNKKQIKITAEIQASLSWLYTQAPKRDLSWAYDIIPVTVNVPDTLHGSSFETFEAPWRDAALKQLGFKSGFKGVRDYIQKLKTELNTDRAYCAFFTKYTLQHFAYAYSGGPHLVMHYANDGWGVDNIDRVFAHETCHIFNAPDEYAISDCDCKGAYGPDKVPNGNCANCAPNGGVSCIMRANDWAMCDFTRRHIGFTKAHA